MNTEKNNEPQELKCPFCGKTPVYGVFVTSYYFRKEHKLYNSSENLIIPESENDNISDVRNIRSYLTTALYNSRLTLNSYWKSRVNHDMNKR